MAKGSVLIPCCWSFSQGRDHNVQDDEDGKREKDIEPFAWMLDQVNGKPEDGSQHDPEIMGQFPDLG